MPVKNVKRKTNDGFEGVITGLNDKEKEIIANSVGIEANPADEATETLEKLKVADTTYNVGVENITANGTYAGEDSGIVINSISLTAEQREKIKSGNVSSISGTFALSNGETNYLTSYIGKAGEENAFSGLNLTSGGDNISITLSLLSIPNDNATPIEACLVDFLMIPPLPSDALEKTLSLTSTNGTIGWEESSGGASYTAGKNISISATNEISVADEMNNLKSIELANSDSRYQNVYISSQYNSFIMKKKDSLPNLFFSRNSTPYKSVELLWLEEPYDSNSQIYFSLHNESKEYYAFTSRSKIPDVPAADGTYVLKAVVSSGTLTYSWVKEGE